MNLNAYKASATNLLQLTKPAIQNWLGTFDVVLTDCDGVLWHDEHAIEGSPDTINALQALGKRVFLITNNGTKTRQEIWQRANRMGYQVDEDDIIAPTHSIVEYLKQRNFQKKAYVIGSSGLVNELNNGGIENFGYGPDVMHSKVNDYIQSEIIPQRSSEVGAVIIGFDEHFSYGKMMKATHFLTAHPECLFLATNTDPVHKYPKYYIPGTGALLSSLEVCAEREAIVFGKPNPMVCEHLLKDGIIMPERTLMIGDCCKIDVTFGKNCGFQTLIVGTGSYPLNEIAKLKENEHANHKHIPDFYLPKLGDLLEYL